jgi:DNA-binding response OmpR family regulator
MVSSERPEPEEHALVAHDGEPVDGRAGGPHWRGRPAGDQPRLPRAIAARAERPLSAHRILVVEPDERLGRLLCTALRSRGWAVDCLGDAAPVEDAVTGDGYALVLIDLLPGIESESLLHTALSAQPGQRVIVISDSPDKQWIVQCFNAGVVDYLCKPFVLAELLARVHARLRLPAPAVARPERVSKRGGVTLDFCRHTGDIGRGPVRLTAREFVLLDYLATNGGRVHTREELLSSAWGLPFDPASNLVEVYVRRLRLKLGEDVIETVHRKGYTIGRSATEVDRVSFLAGG